MNATSGGWGRYVRFIAHRSFTLASSTLNHDRHGPSTCAVDISLVRRIVTHRCHHFLLQRFFCSIHQAQLPNLSLRVDDFWSSRTAIRANNPSNTVSPPHLESNFPNTYIISDLPILTSHDECLDHLTLVSLLLTRRALEFKSACLGRMCGGLERSHGDHFERTRKS